MKPLISVIVPVYNVEKFLDSCIESLISQTYDNLEIILVDDGAKDSSGEICDSYALKDNRIKVIHKQNAGVSKARNTGMENMTGEYFCFIDGDDYVHEDYIDAMYSLITEYGADIAMCGYVFKWRDGKEVRTRNTEYPDSHIFSDSGCDAMCKMLHSDTYAPACWGKLFTSSKFSFTFPEFPIGEDMLASISYLQKADKVVMTNRRLYYYMQNDESVMHSVNPEKVFALVTSGDEILSLIPADNKAMQAAASNYIAEKNLMALMKLYPMKNQKDKIRHIKSNLKKHRLSVLKNPKALRKTKIACLFSYFGVNTLCIIRNLVAK